MNDMICEACRYYLNTLKLNLDMATNQRNKYAAGDSYSAAVANFDLSALDEEKRWGFVHSNQKIVNKFNEDILQLDASIKRLEAEIEINKLDV